MKRGSRLWVQFAPPDVWRLVHDYFLQMDSLERAVIRRGNSFVFGVALP